MVRFELQEPIDREGPILVKRVALTDQRGSLSRLFCAESLKDFFSSEGVVQINHTVTNKAGTVRGFHFQTGASAEAKLVICLKGRVLDVAVDLRKYSKTLCKTYAAELSPENCNAFLIPRGFAHGFQALEDDTQLIYLHDNFYDPYCEGGVSVYDPKVNFHWPMPVYNLSERDSGFKYLSKDFEGFNFEL